MDPRHSLLEKALAILQDAICIVDENGKVLYINASWQALMAMHFGRVAGLQDDLLDFVPQERKQLHEGFIRKAKRLLVRMGQSIKLIDLDQVAYFYSKDKISFAVLPGNKRYPLDQSLDQIEHMVDPLHFFRINRQFIVKMESIDEMIAYSKSRVKLKLNPPTEEDAIVSKERSPEFKKWLVGTD